MNSLVVCVALFLFLAVAQSTEIHSWPVFTGWPGFGLLGYYGRRNGPYHFMSVKPAAAKTTPQASATSTTIIPATATTTAPVTSTATTVKELGRSTAFAASSTVAASAVASTAPTVAGKRESTVVSSTAKPTPSTRLPIKLSLNKVEAKSLTQKVTPIQTSKDAVVSKTATP